VKVQNEAGTVVMHVIISSDAMKTQQLYGRKLTLLTCNFCKYSFHPIAMG